ncbi:Chemotaxis phosphatase, CheZ [Cohaesibacter sp. ES.047]|uniref:protein phosphatase CheZ n=1 Tax=Cohaesibacter sp. ES.047 TaxID=1798205 RepID=UPI000BC0D2AB|nr:protein phosphatase CheZ [Cohaesibacter sp. ES.047]SNY94303.1 Chemotaxis phosphatase, CheZ [Cohaesibacter sp. ES.047]
MPPTPLRQEDYLAIEAAVMETARGRWFLSEYARRNRNADTDTLLNAIDKLEKTVVREQAPSSLMHRVKLDLADMAAAIEKTKKEIAQIKHEDNDGAERFERASSELDAIVSQTETATSDILGAAEKIQEFAWTFREQGVEEAKCDALDMEATNIYMACSFQDLTGQRIRKIVDAMRYVESRINSMVDIWGFEAKDVDIDHSHAKAHDTRPDRHLLNGPALAGEGVEQDDVDALMTHAGDELESNQDDVDALFNNMGSAEDSETLDADNFEAVAADDFDAVSADDFEAVSAEVETSVDDSAETGADDFDAVSADDFEAVSAEAETSVDDSADAAPADAEVESVSEDEYMELDSLSWAEDSDGAEAAGEAESAEASEVSDASASAAEPELTADVFETDDADKTAEELVAEIDADIFASAADAEEADVFARSDLSEDDAEEAASEEADLVDRVAQFS